MMKRGKLIVIEGIDGTGKATQASLLRNRLSSLGFDVKYSDFPQYSQPSGYFAAKYLRGEYGPAKQVGPYRGSVFYAVDRYDKSFDIRWWLANRKLVLSVRYVSASMGHQAGKIKNKKERDRFLKWLEHFEYELMGIPRPDLVILLYLQPEVAQQLVDKKRKRAYTHGAKRDIHEDDLSHLKQAAKAYLEVANKYGWTVINCEKNGKVMPISEIHQIIFGKVCDALGVARQNRKAPESSREKRKSG